MVKVCLYFNLDLDLFMSKYRVYDIGQNNVYFDDNRNKEHIVKISKESIMPTNKILSDLIKIYGDKFKVNFSVSGLAFEMFEKYAPEVIESFEKLAKTGCVEFVSQTYYGTLDVSYSLKEFLFQFEKYNDFIKSKFDLDCKVFKNSEFNYTKEVLDFLSENNFEAVLIRSLNSHLKPSHKVELDSGDLGFLEINSGIADEVQRRFSDQTWDKWPYDAKKLANSVSEFKLGEVLNLFFDYEYFGYKNRDSSGIFDFLKYIPNEFFNLDGDFEFSNVAEVISDLEVLEDGGHTQFLSSSIDASEFYETYLGNKLQKHAISEFFDLENHIFKSEDENLIDSWRKLSSCNHFYFMNTRVFSGNNRYENPYRSPYDTYVYFMNILNDMVFKLRELGVLPKPLPVLSSSDSVDSVKDEVDVLGSG
ncbi:MAG: hypothetical protein KC550_01385 [Nanoarchaeota archaeon]|nr:hypothetical protein [Nanoarchaeota archaeon]